MLESPSTINNILIIQKRNTVTKETWKSIALKTTGDAFKKLGYFGYFLSGVAVFANTKIKIATGLQGEIPIDVTIRPDPIEGTYHISGHGEWGNATIETKGEFGTANITTTGLFGNGFLSTSGWHGGANITTSGWSGDVDISGRTQFNNVHVNGSINPNVTFNGTISLENLLPLLDIAPWILLVSSTALYSTGRILELAGKNFEKPAILTSTDQYIPMYGINTFEDRVRDEREKDDEHKKGCCVLL